MEAAGQRDDAPAGEASDDQPTRVSRDRRRREAGNVAEFHGRRVLDARREAAQARAQHDPKRRLVERADATTHRVCGATHCFRVEACVVGHAPRERRAAISSLACAANRTRSG